MDPFAHSSKAKAAKHLVVDTGGFIKYAELQNLGETIYTLPDVIEEIKDKTTKERLALFPFELHFREPTQECVKTVTEFAKKTGDFNNLSATDIRVIALTLLLESEYVGTYHVRKEPVQSKTNVHVPLSNDAENILRQKTTPGFYLPKEEETDSLSSKTRSTRSSECESTSTVTYLRGNSSPSELAKNLEEINLSDPINEEQEWEPESEEEEIDLSEGQSFCENNTEVQTLVADETNEEDENDDEGWITPKNVKEVYKKLGVNQKASQSGSREVACLTSDFSVQNVLFQMGLHAIGPDGMLIKSLKTYALRCFGCFKITHNTTKRFCPSCGNATLKRVCVTVDKNGQMQYHISTRRPLNTRGTKFSLPMPKGGKHAVNPVLSEDQPRPHFCAPKKSLQRLNVFDPEYVARDSPFLTNDLTSRASQLGRRGVNHFGETKQWMAKNPNAVRKPRK